MYRGGGPAIIGGPGNRGAPLPGGGPGNGGRPRGGAVGAFPLATEPPGAPEDGAGLDEPPEGSGRGEGDGLLDWGLLGSGRGLLGWGLLGSGRTAGGPDSGRALVGSGRTAGPWSGRPADLLGSGRTAGPGSGRGAGGAPGDGGFLPSGRFGSPFEPPWSGRAGPGGPGRGGRGVLAIGQRSSEARVI
ncbi:hypothetical protein GCM10023321_30560 [Pseudonocardia eucalypti]|uniref:Uncharacterized protein n=1 Tax=Pseudonocardia eucalypti TaxID=648755 RepID=A0ABP9Q328_9PSEU